MRLSKKVTLATDESCGIKFTTAKILSEKGETVVITVKDPERLEKSTLKIPNAIGIISDIRSDVKNDVNQTVEKFSKLDIPVNNAVILSVDEGESIK